MDFGNKILELRKKKNFSQEQLAEKINVTRQTISKWELNETTPDIKQAKELSKLFNISLDELVGNSKKDIQYEKINNIEDTSKIILRITKITGITMGILLFLILIIFGLILFFLNYYKVISTGEGLGTYCEYNDNIIYYEVTKDYKNNQLYFHTIDTETKNKFNSKNYKESSEMLKDIISYVESNGGKCQLDLNKIQISSNTNN